MSDSDSYDSDSDNRLFKDPEYLKTLCERYNLTEEQLTLWESQGWTRQFVLTWSPHRDPNTHEPKGYPFSYHCGSTALLKKEEEFRKNYPIVNSIHNLGPFKWDFGIDVQTVIHLQEQNSTATEAIYSIIKWETPFLTTWQNTLGDSVIEDPSVIEALYKQKQSSRLRLTPTIEIQIEDISVIGRTKIPYLWGPNHFKTFTNVPLDAKTRVCKIFLHGYLVWTSIPGIFDEGSKERELFAEHIKIKTDREYALCTYLLGLG